MKRILKRLSPLIMSAAIICSAVPVSAANYEIPGTCRVQADAGVLRTVKTLDYGYENNTYLSAGYGNGS